MAEDNEDEEEEIEEEKPPVKKKTKPQATIVQVDNHETNDLLREVISLLKPTTAQPAPTQETSEDQNDDKKENPTDEPKRGGLSLFRNPFDKR